VITITVFIVTSLLKPGYVLVVLPAVEISPARIELTQVATGRKPLKMMSPSMESEHRMHFSLALSRRYPMTWQI